MATLLTVGHGEATQTQLTDLLAGAGVGLVVDVRRFPGSRRHPHFARAEMEQWLPASGIGYRWEPRLGGRRRVPRDDADADSDPWWRVAAFRAYAAHTRTPEFRAATGDLLADVSGREDRVAIMCSESLWWRCHRRLIADAAVLLDHVSVRHLGHDGKLTDHVPAAGARISAEGLRYDLADAVP
ncbi:DUF488 family protein [Nocardioides mesophilus]|uniref:DUF488 domain-containing protein n=1 Tax=Nocardioides mesophilus TaxID=433659 RepID=A0A7G9REJ6_9ACTN|nr:DUF488 domain-containing protein [Nocardioides mesophilus]QNN54021.1 DUF488 domain-containing protein [Nocardioides mesophilus]